MLATKPDKIAYLSYTKAAVYNYQVRIYVARNGKWISVQIPYTSQFGEIRMLKASNKKPAKSLAVRV